MIQPRSFLRIQPIRHYLSSPINTARSRRSNVPHAFTPLRTPKLHLRAMATRDVTHLSDISKGKMEPDGSFKRKASSFRNFIEKGGEFAPEKGKLPVVCARGREINAICPAGRYHLYVSYACRE